VTAGQWGRRHQIEGHAVEFRTDDAQLLGLWTATRLLGVIREIEDPGDQAELLTKAQVLLTAFVLGLEPRPIRSTRPHPCPVSAGS